MRNETKELISELESDGGKVIAVPFLENKTPSVHPLQAVAYGDVTDEIFQVSTVRLYKDWDEDRLVYEIKSRLEKLKSIEIRENGTDIWRELGGDKLG